MCKRALIHVSQLWVILLFLFLLCTLCLLDSRWETLNGIAHATITKEMLRLWLIQMRSLFIYLCIYLFTCYVSPCKAAQNCDRERLQCSLFLHLVVWRPLWGWTSEERLLKKQVVWVLAHSLPVVLPEGLPWKQGVWQALGGSATAAGTSFLTAWWRHHCHTMHNNNNYWRKKCDQTMLTAVWLKCSLASL